MVFSEADKRSIEAAVKAAELKSAGEIVVAAVGKSGAYGGERCFAATVLAFVSAPVLALLVPDLSLTYVLAVQPIVFTLAWLLLGVPMLCRLIVGAAKLDAFARARAHAMFSELGIHTTRDGTGVLIYLSELEQRVVILGDHGINAKLGDTAWAEHVRTVTSGIRSGKPAQGVLDVVSILGDTLATHFPRQIGDVNELPDAVIERR